MDKKSKEDKMQQKENFVTKEQFEKDYAERNGITVEELYDSRLKSVPCDCGDPICRGWIMVYEKNQKEDQ